MPTESEMKTGAAHRSLRTEISLSLGGGGRKSRPDGDRERKGDWWEAKKVVPEAKNDPTAPALELPSPSLRAHTKKTGNVS